MPDTIPSPRSAGSRVHIVLVPGFCGFDALGQVEYYSDVTPLFDQWKRVQTHAVGVNLVLHYFDNFPTAAVAARARRLEHYLAKRVARQQFQNDDAIVLIGHSTGGLDMRQLVADLANEPERQIPVDGSATSACQVMAGDILKKIRGLVFLSVPQYGTNIADWVHSHWIERKAVLADMRLAVGSARLPAVDTLETGLLSAVAGLTDAEFVLAARDALAELDADRRSAPDAVLAADEAASQLALWLQQMAADFRAIDDLMTKPPDGPLSPAHFDDARRGLEQDEWARWKIKTRSYATLGRRPFLYKDSGPKYWSQVDPTTWPIAIARDPQNADTDLGYRVTYCACAAGPLAGRRAPLPWQASQFLSVGQQNEIERWNIGRDIQVWDNDAIVNTVSMFWPDGTHTFLVPGDHFDIVGHYEQTPARGGAGRTFHSYNLFRSGSGFHQHPQWFKEVWSDVFEFCACC